jgi:large subunit ribosomal protein L31e
MEEKIYNIPIGKAYKKARLKRMNYAVKMVKSYLKKHTKAEEIKLGKNLNEKMWKRSIEKPPKFVRVKVIIDAGIAKAELLGFEYIDFKTKPKTEKKGMKERLMERLGPKAVKKEEEEKMIDEKKEIAAPEKIEKPMMEK